MKSFKVDDAWAVELDDVEWFTKDEATQKTIIENARSAARENGCTSFAVFVNPDMLFPLGGLTTKKRIHNEQLAQGKSFEMSCVHVVTLVPEIWQSLDDKGRRKLLGTVEDIIAIKGRTNPGRYEIVVPKGDGTNEYIQRGPAP